MSDGLCDEFITSSAIDTNGYLWFGTGHSGVLKFDGQNWTCYNNENGLSSNYVDYIAVDVDNNKWIATDSGVSKFEDYPVCIKSTFSAKRDMNLVNYPNPASSETTVLFPHSGKYNLFIFNFYGKKVKQFMEVTSDRMCIKTQDMDSGIYLITCESVTTGNIYKGRLIVIR
jgi:hypothetical protein